MGPDKTIDPVSPFRPSYSADVPDVNPLPRVGRVLVPPKNLP